MFFTVYQTRRGKSYWVAPTRNIICSHLLPLAFLGLRSFAQLASIQESLVCFILIAWRLDIFLVQGELTTERNQKHFSFSLGNYKTFYWMLNISHQQQQCPSAGTYFKWNPIDKSQGFDGTSKLVFSSSLLIFLFWGEDCARSVYYLERMQYPKLNSTLNPYHQTNYSIGYSMPLFKHLRVCWTPVAKSSIGLLCRFSNIYMSKGNTLSSTRKWYTKLLSASVRRKARCKCVRKRKKSIWEGNPQVINLHIVVSLFSLVLTWKLM